MPTYAAHRLSSGNTVFPDRLEINTTNVVYYKGDVFGYKSTILSRNNVASVSIKSHIMFADLMITSFGGDRIIAEGLLKRDAKNIIRLLT